MARQVYSGTLKMNGGYLTQDNRKVRRNTFFFLFLVFLLCSIFMDGWWCLHTTGHTSWMHSKKKLRKIWFSQTLKQQQLKNYFFFVVILFGLKINWEKITKVSLRTQCPYTQNPQISLLHFYNWEQNKENRAKEKKEQEEGSTIGYFTSSPAPSRLL